MKDMKCGFVSLPKMLKLFCNSFKLEHPRIVIHNQLFNSPLINFSINYSIVPVSMKDACHTILAGGCLYI